ncbi:hypothetical protein NA78x_002499 [Anatilimnocola sp. NA78]|uniref:hypothetical protein n=1 Tax=Anatilimnocola sp. NA78 TaxID=3415683 RepID=UPI003CE57DE1
MTNDLRPLRRPVQAVQNGYQTVIRKASDSDASGIAKHFQYSTYCARLLRFESLKKLSPNRLEWGCSGELQIRSGLFTEVAARPSKETHRLNRRCCPVQTVLSGYQTGYQLTAVDNDFERRNALKANHLSPVIAVKKFARKVIKTGYQGPVQGLLDRLASAKANEPPPQGRWRLRRE